MRIIQRTEVVVLTICVVVTAMLYAAHIAGAQTVATEVTEIGTANTTNKTAIAQVLPTVVITATPALCGSGSVNLAWNAVPGAEGYSLYRDSSSNKIYEGTDLMHVDNGLAKGTNHMYYLQAFKNGYTSSNASTPALAPIECPTVIEPYGGDAVNVSGGDNSGTSGTTGQAIPLARNLTAILDPVEHGVVLMWTADSGATSFGIFRRALASDFVGVGSVNAPTHTFVDHQLVPGAQYEYQVRVCSSSGCSTSSNVVGVSIPAVTAQPVVASTTSTHTTIIAAASATTTTSQSATPAPVVPIKVFDPAVVKTIPAIVQQSAPHLIQVSTFPVTPSNGTSNIRVTVETRTAASDSAIAPSQVVASMQAAAQTVSTSQSVVNSARDALIASIDAHIDAVLQIAGADQRAREEGEIRPIREALVADIDTKLTGGAGLSPKDEMRMQTMIQDGFAVIDKTASLDSNVPDSTRQAALDAVGSLATVTQSAAESLKANGAGDLYKDTNHDGISDYDSVRLYHLDPVAPSPVTVVEGKSLSAGDKVLLGYDPTAAVLMAVPHEEPAVSFAPETTIYTVTEVKLTPQKQLAITGTALPNSFVTLYIYSTPIVVTVKTDSSGKWKYTVDRELDSGEHKIYAASVDNTGKIVAKTIAIPFTKTAEAATLDTVPSVGVASVEKPSLSNNRAALPLIAISILFIFGVLFVIGKDRNPKNNPPAASA